MAQPIIKGGVFSSPNALGISKRQFIGKNGHSQNGIRQGGGHGEDEQASEAYPLGVYWKNVDALNGLSAMDTGNDEDDQEERYDEHGVRLPDPILLPEQVTKKTENIVNLFNRERLEAEHDFSPMGLTSTDGQGFQMMFPPGETGQRLIAKLINVAFIVNPATARFKTYVEGMVVSSNILPCPLHVSPLALALVREKSACPRFTDAISSACRLHVLRKAILELDTATPEHKQVCEKFRRVIEGHISGIFYREIDRLTKLVPLDTEDRRLFQENVVRAFGAASDAYSLAYVHLIEWNICDMLRVPYGMRHLLMTPQMFPAPSQGAAFHVLRLNLANYVRRRNTIYCWVLDEKTNAYTHVDPTSWMPMNLEEPRLENRLVELAQWIRGASYEARCIYGVYNDWIDMHTLREYMLLLSTDTREKPASLLKKRDQSRVRTEEEELAEGSSTVVPMETGGDDE